MAVGIADAAAYQDRVAAFRRRMAAAATQARDRRLLNPNLLADEELAGIGVDPTRDRSDSGTAPELPRGGSLKDAQATGAFSWGRTGAPDAAPSIRQPSIADAARYMQTTDLATGPNGVPAAPRNIAEASQAADAVTELARRRAQSAVTGGVAHQFHPDDTAPSEPEAGQARAIRMSALESGRPAPPAPETDRRFVTSPARRGGIADFVASQDGARRAGTGGAGRVMVNRGGRLQYVPVDSATSDELQAGSDPGSHVSRQEQDAAGVTSGAGMSLGEYARRYGNGEGHGGGFVQASEPAYLPDSVPQEAHVRAEMARDLATIRDPQNLAAKQYDVAAHAAPEVVKGQQEGIARAAGMQELGRLDKLRAVLQDEVASGRRDQADASSVYADAERQTMAKLQTISSGRGDFLGWLRGENDPNSLMSVGGGPPAGSR